FAELLRTIDFSALTAPAITAAIIVPSYFNTTYPFAWEDRRRIFRTLLQSYVLCVAAGLEAELVPETADLRRYKLLLAPATQKLLATTWRACAEHVRRGANFYWSYFGGDYDFHQGAWCHNFSELVGCEHELRYGCLDLPDAEQRIAGRHLSL